MAELGELTLVEWVLERFENCQEISKTKTGKDRDGWLEDGRYFGAILELLTTAEKLKPYITRGGVSPYEKRYSTKDVEAFMGMAFAIVKKRATDSASTEQT